MNTIESLKELYVKLGGSLEDVENISTIPETIDAISEVAGGGEPSYETVAEIPVGTMVENEGVYQYEVPSESRPNLQGEDLKNLYIDGHKLERLNAELFAYNLDPQTMRPIASPAYGLGFDGGEETGYDLLGIVTYPDLSNTTVKILKKVEQGGGELPEVTSADNGDVLTVVEGAWAKAEPSVLPAYDTTDDLGKVLTVTANGLAWVTPT